MPSPFRNQQRSMQLVASVLFWLVGGSAWAGFVTIDPGALTTIFSQSAFDGKPVQVRVNPTVTLNAPGLETINTEAQLNALFALGGNGPAIDVFFVDAINECGGDLSPQTIGCGEEPGNKIAVESVFAANTGSAAAPGSGSILIGHEVGHNLGLDHIESTPNLMNPELGSSFALSTHVGSPPVNQIATILSSSLVQMDNGQRFISITPFAVVPEPATMLFALAGALWLLQRARRRLPA